MTFRTKMEAKVTGATIISGRAGIVEEKAAVEPNEVVDSTANAYVGNPPSSYLSHDQKAIRNQPQPIVGRETVKSIEHFGPNNIHTAEHIEQQNPLTAIPVGVPLPKDRFGHPITHNVTNKLRLRDENMQPMATYMSHKPMNIGDDHHIEQTDIYGPDNVRSQTFFYDPGGAAPAPAPAAPAALAPPTVMPPPTVQPPSDPGMKGYTPKPKTTKPQTKPRTMNYDRPKRHSHTMGRKYIATDSHVRKPYYGPPDLVDHRVPRFHAYERNIPYDSYGPRMQRAYVRRHQGMVGYAVPDMTMNSVDEDTLLTYSNFSQNAGDDDMYETTDDADEMATLTDTVSMPMDFVDTYATQLRQEEEEMVGNPRNSKQFDKIIEEGEEIFHSCFHEKKLKVILEVLRKTYGVEEKSDQEYGAMELRMMQEITKCVRRLMHSQRKRMTWQVVVGRKFVGLLAQDTGRYTFFRKNDLYVLITGCSYLRRLMR